MEYNDDGLHPLVDGFIDQMPSLILWQLGECWSQKPLLKACHHRLSPIQKPELLDSTAKFKYVGRYSKGLDRQEDQCDLLLEAIIWSFLNLKEESKVEEKNRAVTMLQNMIPPSIRNYAKAIISLISVQNIGNSDVRLVMLEGIKQLKRTKKDYYRSLYTSMYGRYLYRQSHQRWSYHVVRFLTAPKRRRKQQKLSKFQQQNTHSFAEKNSPFGALIRKYYDTTVL